VDTVDGGKTCRNRVPVCDPSCDPETHLCEAGQCVPICNPPCTRRNYVCDTETRDCVRVRRRCSPRCRGGKVCRRGRCVTRPQPGCSPACRPGQLCRNRRCVPSGGDDSPQCPACSGGQVCSAATGYRCVDDEGNGSATGPIRGRVVSLVRSGQGTIVYINRGSRAGVERAKTGRLCGRFSFTVTNVYSARSKARTNASVEEIGDCRSAVINR
jgi:hypothetical protein